MFEYAHMCGMSNRQVHDLHLTGLIFEKRSIP